jgi:hypothetical protein
VRWKPVPTIEEVAEAGDGREALKCIAKVLPTVVVMDIVMPRMDGMQRPTNQNTVSADCCGRTHPRAEGLQVVFHEKGVGLRSRGQPERRGGDCMTRYKLGGMHGR